MRLLIAINVLIYFFSCPALAKPNITEIITTFCNPIDIEGEFCRKAKNYPGNEEECSVRILKGNNNKPFRIYQGDFIRQGQEVYLIEYSSICEDSIYNRGGSLIIKKTKLGYEFINYARGFAKSKCLNIYRKHEKDRLFCTGYYMQHGLLETTLFEANLVNDISGNIIFSSDVLLSAAIDAGELNMGDPSDGWSSTFVNCSKSRELFELEIKDYGPDQYSLIIATLYADSNSIQDACKKNHIPNKNLIMNKAPENHAFIHSSKMKKNNLIFDIVGRNLIPIEQYKAIKKNKIISTNQIKKTTNQFPLIVKERRVALVIGNADYQNVSKLKNSLFDASAIVKKFKALGFQNVIHETNLNKQKFEKTLLKFSDISQNSDWSVVYYAGHGIELEGENYLIPIDAKLNSDKHIKFETVSLDHVIESAGGTKKLSLVILDACRNNPFLTSIKKTILTRSITSGLAKIEPSAGVLVAYAAKHGMVALDGETENSPFVKAILKHIEEPNLDINLLFRKVRDTVLNETNNQQEPYIYGSLPGQNLSFQPTQ